MKITILSMILDGYIIPMTFTKLGWWKFSLVNHWGIWICGSMVVNRWIFRWNSYHWDSHGMFFSSKRRVSQDFLGKQSISSHFLGKQSIDKTRNWLSSCPFLGFPMRRMKGPWPRCHRHPLSERLADRKATVGSPDGGHEVFRTKLEGFRDLLKIICNFGDGSPEKGHLQDFFWGFRV